LIRYAIIDPAEERVLIAHTKGTGLTPFHFQDFL
jgi:hypothetical protein